MLSSRSGEVVCKYGGHAYAYEDITEQGNEKSRTIGSSAGRRGLLPDWHSELPPKHRKNQQDVAKIGRKILKMQIEVFKSGVYFNYLI